MKSGVAVEKKLGATALDQATSKKAIVYIPSSRGGISVYATEQARELATRGWQVTVLASNALQTVGLNEPFFVSRRLVDVPDSIRNRSLRRLWFVARVMVNHTILAIDATKQRPDLVLTDAYGELLAPLWAWMHWLPRKLGVIYATTIHDPERKQLFGPGWWHRLSVRCGYQPFSIGLIHGLGQVSKKWQLTGTEIRDVPHGVFATKSSAGCNTEGRHLIRTQFRIPDDSTVFLAFGFVADRKNLDLAIRALSKEPSIHLIVAGSRASARDRPVEYYRALASNLGVANRVHFDERYLADADVEAYFEAADAILLTYSAEFVSQSGVLHFAANWSKPVLASSGSGPLIDTVRRYKLGVVVEPESENALRCGLRDVAAGNLPPLGWDSFRKDASWTRNIDQLLDAFGQVESKRRLRRVVRR